MVMSLLLAGAEIKVGGDEVNKQETVRVPECYPSQVQRLPFLSTLSVIQCFIHSVTYSSLSALESRQWQIM